MPCGMAILWRTASIPVLLAALVFAGCRGVSEPDSVGSAGYLGSAEPFRPERIQAGDCLSVACVAGAPSPGWVLVTNEYVRPDGTLTLISNRLFVVAGKTCEQLGKEMHDYYVPTFYRSLDVRIDRLLRVVHVRGEVRSPGRPRFPGQMTVLEAVEASGGFTRSANPKKVQITELEGHQSTVDCIRARTDPSENRQISPGDVITVPRSFWWWLKVCQPSSGAEPARQPGPGASRPR